MRLKALTDYGKTGMPRRVCLPPGPPILDGRGTIGWGMTGQACFLPSKPVERTMGGVLHGRLLLALCALATLAAPTALASPPPDPTLPPPEDIQYAYNQTTQTINLTWQAPDGVEESEAGYLVYINGEPSTYTTDPLAFLPIPDGPMLVSLATVVDGAQGPMSMPLLFGTDWPPSIVRFAVLLQWEGKGGPLPPICPMIGIGPNPNPPYVVNFAYDCIPEPFATILWELLH